MGSVDCESKGVPPVQVVLDGRYRAVSAKKPEQARFEAYLQARTGKVNLESGETKDHPHADLISSIQATLEQELFVWTDFNMQLPPTTITEADLHVVRLENACNEIRQLAFGCEQAERPLLAVSRVWFTMDPYLTLRVKGIKNEAWTMRDCHISVTNDDFWAALKIAYGSFQVSAAKVAGHPASLLDLNLINPAEFNSVIAEGSSIEFSIKTTRALKGALKRLNTHGNPHFDVQFRVSTQENASQRLLFTLPLRASDLLSQSPDFNLATPAMGERFTGPPPAPAVGGGLTRKKLSPAQLSQIWHTRTLGVPSVQYPGTVHVWEISKLLASGATQRKSDRNGLLAHSFNQLSQTAWRFYNPFAKRSISLARGVHRMTHGLVNLVACTVGVPERKRVFPSDYIERILACERGYFLVTTLGLEFELDLEAAPPSTEEVEVKIHLPPSSEQRGEEVASDTDTLLTPGSSPIEASQQQSPTYRPPQGLKFQSGLIIPFALEEFEYDILQRLNALLPEVNRRWRMDRMNFACEEERKLREELKLRETTPSAVDEDKDTIEIMSRLKTALEAEFERRVLGAVREDNGLQAIHPLIPHALYRHLLAVRIVTRLRTEAQYKYNTAQLSEAKERKEAHPILSKINWWNDWMNSKREKYDSLKPYQEALVQLNHANLPEYAAILGT